jgi:protoporphyrinogen oxidase
MAKIAVIGGGISGLSASYRLAEHGHDVTLFEGSNELGGLAGSFSVNGTYLEKFYHHIFRTDGDVIGLIKRLGIGNNLEWHGAKMGFYVDNGIHPFNSALDIIGFRPLSVIGRIKYGTSVLKLCGMDWRELDSITARDWLMKNAGDDVYRKLWEPLLKIKFGSEFDKISAAWVWGRLKSRTGSKNMFGEKLGYMKGGFGLMIDRLEEKLSDSGCMIKKGSMISSVRRERNSFSIRASGVRKDFDSVISTVPLPALTKICSFGSGFDRKMSGIKYQGVVCMTLILKKSLSDYYWTNISDSRIPFGGVIEHTNLVPSKDYGGNIVYLFNYTPANGQLYRMSNQKLFSLYEKGLKLMFPGYRSENVAGCRIFREKFASPVYTTNYAESMPPMMPVKNLFIATTAQIYPEDRNMNNSVKLGESVARAAEENL